MKRAFVEVVECEDITEILLAQPVWGTTWQSFTKAKRLRC